MPRSRRSKRWDELADLLLDLAHMVAPLLGMVALFGAIQISMWLTGE